MLQGLHRLLMRLLPADLHHVVGAAVALLSLSLQMVHLITSHYMAAALSSKGRSSVQPNGEHVHQGQAMCDMCTLLRIFHDHA